MSAPVPPSAPDRKPGVLVVDDDTVLLFILAEVLAACGFAVWTATGGEEAVRIYRENRESIDVALLDVQMVGMDGPEALFTLQQVNPEVRALFMSGVATERDWDGLRGMGALDLVAKPFNSADLAQKLWLAARGLLAPS